jgi:hypothetical protein
MLGRPVAARLTVAFAHTLDLGPRLVVDDRRVLAVDHFAVVTLELAVIGDRAEQRAYQRLLPATALASRSTRSGQVKHNVSL